MTFLINWIIRAILILLTAYLVPAFRVNGFNGAFLLVLVLGVLNVLIKPLLVVVTLPINILTLGLFTLIINALVLGLATRLVPGVSSDSFATTFMASVVLSLLSMLANILKK